MGVRHIRFQPDPMDQAVIDLNDQSSPFMGTYNALILNESFTGCALVIHATKALVPGNVIRIKAGRLDPTQARIVWMKPLDKDLLKVGIEFLE